MYYYRARGNSWFIAFLISILFLITVLLWREFFIQPKILDLAKSKIGVSDHYILKIKKTPQKQASSNLSALNFEEAFEIEVIKIPSQIKTLSLNEPLKLLIQETQPKTSEFKLPLRFNIGLMHCWSHLGGYASFSPFMLKTFKPAFGILLGNGIYPIAGLEKHIFEVAETSGEHITYVSVGGYWAFKVKKPFLGVSIELKWDI